MLVLIIFALLLPGCSDNKAAPVNREAQAAPVYISKAVLKSVPIEIETVGNVEAYSTVLVKAQIGGELTIVDFTEGADVHKGDRLFVIDPRPYETQVAQAEATIAKDKAQFQAAQANLARDMAQEEFARSQAQRFSELSLKGVLAKESAEQADSQAKAAAEAIRADRAAIESMQANTAADQAALDRAKLQLEYCTIRSPIDGRTGHLIVKQGNVIKANDVDLVTINQLHPIYVTFTVPETNLQLIKTRMAAGNVFVEAELQGDSKVERGKLSFVENSVDSTTGTIRLKARFDNGGTQRWARHIPRGTSHASAAAHSILFLMNAAPNPQQVKIVHLLINARTSTAPDRSVG